MDAYLSISEMTLISSNVMLCLFRIIFCDKQTVYQNNFQSAKLKLLEIRI